MKKLLLTILLFPNILFGLTYSTHTVMPTGGDYPSLFLWYNGEVKNLVTGDLNEAAMIDGVWTSSDTTTPIDLYNFTTDATHRVHIYTTALARSTGTWDLSKYRLCSKDTSLYMPLRIRSMDVDIDGLQFEYYGEASGGDIKGLLAELNSGAYTINVSNCILKYTGTSIPTQWADIAFRLNTGTSVGVLKYYNNIAYGFGTGFFYGYNTSASTVACYNNTFLNCNNGGGNGAGIVTYGNDSTVAMYIKNNIIASTGTQSRSYYGGWTSTAICNVAWDNNGPNAAFNNLNPNFVNVQGNNVFLVNTDTCAYLSGMSLNPDSNGICNVTTDLAGVARPTPKPSIGALELPAAAPPVTDTIRRYWKSTWFK